MSSPSRGIEKGRSTFFNPVDLPSIDRDDIILTGFLVKQGGSWKTWKRRFFVLSRMGTLNYYEDANMIKAKGTISCKDAEIRQLPNDGELFFEIAADVFGSVAGRVMKLQAESEEQLFEWIQATRQVSCLYGDRGQNQNTRKSGSDATDTASNSIGLSGSIEEGDSEDEDCQPLC